MRKLINNAYTRALKLIEDNRDKLELIANALLEHETLDGTQVEEIVKTGKFDPPGPPPKSGMKGAEASTPNQESSKKVPPKIDPDLGSAPEPAPA